MVLADAPFPPATRIARANDLPFVGVRGAWRKTSHHQHPFWRPGGYFHKTKTVVGSRLLHPLIARLSFQGYAVKEIALAEGPAEWISLKGRN